MPQLSYPTEPQVVTDGLIDWPRIEIRRRKNGTMYYVPVRCDLCGSERYVQAPSILSEIARGKTTGRCRTCAPLRKREQLLRTYHEKGVEQLPNGASIDWTTAQTPPPGISGKPYTVEMICRCGYRRRRALYAINGTSGLCRQCASSNAHQGDSNPRWKGGHITKSGYRIVRIPPNHPMISMCEITTHSGWGKILEHRLAAALSIGRPLEVWEHVHHLNQDKTDNRPENLQIVTPDKHATITAMEQEIRKLREENRQLNQLIVELRRQSQTTQD